jgi:2-desacetyl-2-hydroxyethyl bacteriochlorophyllide A dehydrogenase
MRAAVLKGARELVVEEVRDPEPEAGEVLVQVETVGICGSDLHLYSSGLLPPGLIMGHETAGVIADVGRGVVGWRTGDRVWLAGGADCGTCEHCLNGQHELCRHHLSLGTGPLPGAYAEFVKVPARFMTRLPDDIDTREAALIEPLGCAHHAVDLSAVEPGQSALVIGGGPIGLFIVHFLKCQGVEPVILSEPNARRAALGRELGADAVLVPSHDDIDKASKDLTSGIGPDVVYECVGSPDTTLASISLVRKCGVVVWVGVCIEEVSFLPALWMLKRPTVLMSFGMGRTRTMEHYLRFVRDRGSEIGRVVTEAIALDQLPAAFERLLKPSDEVKMLVEVRTASH